MRCEVLASMQLAVYHTIGRDDRNVGVSVEGETQKDSLLSEPRCLTDLSAIFNDPLCLRELARTPNALGPGEEEGFGCKA